MVSGVMMVGRDLSSAHSSRVEIFGRTDIDTALQKCTKNKDV